MRNLLIVVVLALVGLALFLLRSQAPHVPDEGERIERRNSPRDGGPGSPPETARGTDGPTLPDAAGLSSPQVAVVPGLRGEVVDESNRPLLGATVHLSRLDPYVLRGGRAAPGARLASAIADGDGRFELALDEHTWARVEASLPGYGAVGVRVPGPGGFVRLVLPPAAGLRVAVQSESGKPIPGAAVEVLSGEALAAERTAEDGRAAFDALAPGRALVTVRAEGYGDARLEPRRVTSGEPLSLRVVLAPAVALSGRVVDAADGGGIGQAVVHVRSAGRTLAMPPTASDGRFGPVAGPAAGEGVLLTATAPGYAPVILPLHVQDSGRGHEIEIALHAAGDWRGRVVDANGAAVPAARVGYTPGGVDARPPATTRTDEDGRFELPPPPLPLPGRRVVLEAQGGPGHAALALRPHDPPPPDLVLVLRRGARVAGRTLGGSGDGADGVTIRLDPQWTLLQDRTRPGPDTARLLGMNERSRLALTTTTQGGGWWALADVPDGPYLVRAETGGATTFGSDVFEVAGADVDTGLLRLASGHVVEGRVRDASGRPLAGVDVTVLSADAPRRSRQTRTDAEGYWRQTGVAAGVHQVRAMLPGHRSHAGLAIDVPREDPVDLVLPEGGLLEGTLQTDGGPWRGTFTLFVENAGRAGRRASLRRTLDTSDGSFSLTGLAEGEWRVRVRTSDGLVGAHSGTLSVRAGASYEVRIQLAKSAGIDGVLRTKTGTPVTRGEVHLKHEASGRTQRVSVDTAGRFRFPGLTEGAWLLMARGHGGAPVSESIDLSTGAVLAHDVRLAEAGSLRIRVVGSDGARRPGAIVTVRPPGRVSGLLPFTTPPRTDAEGKVTIDDLPLGPLVISVRTLAAEQGRIETTLAGGKPVEVTVPVRAARR